MSAVRLALLLLVCAPWPLMAQSPDDSAAPPTPPPALELELDEVGVSIGNVTPGGPVALVLVERGLRGMGGSTVYGTLILSDDDGDLLVLVHPRSLELSLVRVRETGAPESDPETEGEGA